MQESVSRVIRVTNVLAALLSFIVFISFPLIYLSLGYKKVIAILETEAAVDAGVASRMVSQNPLLWRYETLRLEEFLSRGTSGKKCETRLILGENGDVIAQNVTELKWPVISRSAALLDSGRTVGTLRISRSLRGLLTNTAYFAAGGAALGTLMFVFIRMFPLRALNETLASLDELNRTLKQKVMEEVEKGREKDHLLMHQSKLAAMGEMIGSIAHQWRQPLNVIGLIIQDIKNARNSGELNEVYIEESVARAMSIIRHMSATIDDFRYFFRPEKAPRDFNVGEAVVKAVSVVEASFASGNIEIRLDLQDDLVVHGFPSEYSQVLLNLLNNARDVLTEKDVAHPKVDIRLARHNGRVVLTVGDNGGGIREDIMDKIFDPYFTTKPADKGTGIGLYMSKLIIERSMNGELTAANTGEGAEFSISL
jgi:signal transduction histidine kinase